jgi:hypothetical protein
LFDQKLFIHELICNLFFLQFGITTSYRPKVAEIVQNKIIDWAGNVLKAGSESASHLESDILFQSLSNFIWTLEKSQNDDVSAFCEIVLQKITLLSESVYSDGDLATASRFLTFLIGNPSKLSEDKKEKKGGLKFKDETETDVGKTYLTNCFKIQFRKNEGGNANVSFDSLPKVLQKTVLQLSARSVENILSETVDSLSKDHVQFLTDIFECFSFDSQVSTLYSKLPSTSTALSGDAAVDLLQAVAHSKMLSETGEKAAQNENLVNLCLVIARAVRYKHISVTNLTKTTIFVWCPG